MRSLWKFAAGIVAMIVVTIVALLVLAKVMITPERVKAMVVPLAETALQRKVSLGDIKIGLFSGIELHDLVIAEKNGTDRLLTVDLARLRYQWLPLLAKRVIIDEISLEQPRVRVSRDAQGAFSIADLLGVPREGAGSTGQHAVSGAEAPLSLMVSDVRITGGELVFIDAYPDPAQPVRLSLTSLEVKAAGFLPDGNLPLQLTGKLNGAPLAVNGTLRLKEKGGHFRVDLQNLDALPFSPYLGDRLPGRLDALTLDLKAEIDRSAQGVNAVGTLAGRGLTLFLDDLPAAPITNAALRADFDLSSHPDRDAVEVRRLTLDFNGLVLAVTGRLGGLSAQPRADLALTIPGFDLRKAAQALPPGMLGKAAELELSGLLTADLKLMGELREPRTLLRQGTLLLEQVQGNVAGVRPAVNGRLVLAAGSCRIERLTVNLGEITATATGGIESLYTKPVADITVNLPRVEIATALAKVPPELLRGLDGLAPAGQVEARARLVGRLAEPKDLLKNAEVTLIGVQVTAGGLRPEVNGRLKFAGDQLVTEGLSVRLGTDTAQLKGTARNLFGKPVVATLDLSAGRFQLEALLQGGGAAASATGKGAAPTSGAQVGEVGPFDLPLQVNGTIRLGETSWKGLAVRDFIADYALRDNHLTVSRMTGKVAGGAFSNTARIDLSQPGLVYTANLSMQGVQADALLSALAPATSGTLFGAMDLQGSLGGRGTRWESLSRNLTGDGALILTDGRLVSPALVKGFAAFLQIPELDQINFEDFRGKVRIVDGRAAIDSALLSPHLKLFPTGTLGLDGNLDLAMDTRLSPELAARLDQRGQVVRFLADADGWSQVPLLLTGTCQAPRFGLDPKGVRAQATRALQQQLQRGIDKLLNKPLSAPPAMEPPPQTTPPPTEPAGQPLPAEQQKTPPPPPQRKLLEETLQQLFGR